MGGEPLGHRVANHWPVGLAIAILWAGIAADIAFSTYVLNGELVFVYPLDDAYIHMAMAKNLANHGVWGVTPSEFSGSTSSMLWVLLLALVYKTTGLIEFVPLVFNFIVATAILITLYAWLAQANISSFSKLVLLVLVIACAPMCPLAVCGMEHLLHAFLLLLAVRALIAILTQSAASAREVLAACVLAALATAARYESLFALFVGCCLLLFVKKRWREALWIGFAALAPVLVYGCISVYNGSLFVPNSIMVKAYLLPKFIASNTGWSHWLFARFFLGDDKAGEPMALFLLWMISAILLYNSKAEFWSREKQSLLLFSCAAGLHLLFADTGWLYRYEGYLVIWGLFILLVHVMRHTQFHLGPFRELTRETAVPRLLYAALLVVAASPFMVGRAFQAHRDLAESSRGIFEQQYQMARFVKRYYEHDSIVANDIGAITFFSDIRLLDMFGLGSVEIVRMFRDNPKDLPAYMRLLEKKQSTIAISYEFAYDVIPGKAPASWTKIGEWTIEGDPDLMGGNTVTFYATRPTAVESLRRNFAEFRKDLPDSVVVRTY